MMKRLMALMAVASAALACNLVGTQNLVTPEPTATTAPTTDSTAPPPTQTPAPTDDPTAPPPTDDPAATVPPSPTPCDYDADFITDVTIPDGTEVPAGDAFTKTWRLENSGCLAWPDDTQLIFDGGDQMGAPNSVDVPATTPGLTADISVNLTAPTNTGEYRGYWQIVSPEGEEFGPRIFVEISVGQPASSGTPDLTITDISLNPATPSPGGDFTLSVTVTNIGDASAPATALDIDFSAGIPAQTESISKLAAGDSETVTYQGFLKQGSYTVTAAADAGDAVDESDENNNAASLNFDVALPDLSILSLFTQPTTFGDGEDFTVVIDVINDGPGQSPEATLLLEFSSGIAPQTFTVPPLAAGEQARVTYDGFLKAGSYTITATIDPDDDIAEVDSTGESIAIVRDVQ